METPGSQFSKLYYSLRKALFVLEGDMYQNQVIPFNYEDKKIRVVKDEKGELWFVAKDICEALGITWSGHTLDNIPDSWKGMVKLATPSSEHDKRGGGVQKLIIINEPALYKLSFRSNKPEADRFTNWVAYEVLPAIRKTGSYSLPGKEQPDELGNITIKLLADETENAFRMLKRYAITGNQGKLTVNAIFRFCYDADPTEPTVITDLTKDEAEEYLTPTEFGRQIGCSAKKINKLLLEKGLQTSFRNAKGELCYKPTEKGMPFSVSEDTGKREGKSTRKKRLLWKKSVIGIISS